jgi:hypothetical protein
MKESDHAAGQGEHRNRKASSSNEGDSRTQSDPAAPDLPERLRAAAHDERLSTGALYLEAAEVIDALRAAPELPEPYVYNAEDRWGNFPHEMIAKSDYDALRAAYERVVKARDDDALAAVVATAGVIAQRDEENARAIRAEKGWDEAINRAEAAERERDALRDGWAARAERLKCERDEFERLWLTMTEAEHERAEAAEAALVQANESVATSHVETQRLLKLYDEMEDKLAQANAALEIIAGERQCVDNLMGDKDVARAALRRARGAQK